MLTSCEIETLASYLTRDIDTKRQRAKDIAAHVATHEYNDLVQSCLVERQISLNNEVHDLTTLRTKLQDMNLT